MVWATHVYIIWSRRDPIQFTLMESVVTTPYSVTELKYGMTTRLAFPDLHY